MHKMTYLKSLLIILTVLFAVGYTTAQNDNSTGAMTDNVDPDEKSSLEKGMEPIYKLYHNFLGTVMKKSFYDADTPFNVQKLNEIINEQKYSELQSDWQELVKTYGGIAACVIMGLLFVVFMPIVGCIYCCCHCCCHKCGGTKEKNDPKRASCMRLTFSSLLLICATMVLVGCIITFLGSELLKRSLKDEDEKGLISSMDNNLGVLQSFADDTIKDVKVEAKRLILEDGLGQILPEIIGAVNETVNRIQSMLNATVIFETADSLGQAAVDAVKDIEVIQASLANLTTLQINVSGKLRDIKTSIDTECNMLSPSPRPEICSDTSGIAFQPDFNSLGDLQSQLDKAEEAQEINKFVKEAKDEFNKVSNTIDSAVNDSIQDAKREIKQVENSVNKSLEDLNGLAQPFVDSIQKGRDFVGDQRNEFGKVGNYVWYACIGMGCAVLIVVFFYYMGVLFGLCGERPTFNANCCNRGTGANLLCAGICFSFLFAALLMLVVVLMFTLGGLGYTMACRYLNDGIENVDTFETVLSDGFKWNVSQTLGVKDLTIAGMFISCKENEGIYTAFHLSSVFDLDKEFNVTDIKRQVQQIANKSFNISSITLLSSDLKKQLEKLKDTELSKVNFTEYTVELNKPLTGFDIDLYITELREASSSIPKLNQTANDLQSLRDGEIAQIKQEKATLGGKVSSLQKHADVTDEVDDLINSIRRAQNTFNAQKDIIAKEQLGEAVNNILDLINKTVSITSEAIKHTIGQCKPLYNAAQNVADTVCIVTLDPFNAIWFGLGWSLFFYIPCIVFAAVLASLYQRTDKYDPKDKFDDISSYRNSPGYAGYGCNSAPSNDAMPLTSTGRGDRRDRSNGNYNQGYDTREPVPESRFHRDGNYPSDYGRGSAASGHVYDAPITAPRGRNKSYDRDSPPHYDEAVSPGSGGGYPKANRY